MKIIEIFREEEIGYNEICDFADKIYLRELNFKITKFPEFLFAVKEDGIVLGCIGLNKSINCSLFKRDERFIEFLKENDEFSFGEQSILALEKNNSVALTPLITIMFEYAYHIGINKLTFAGIDVSIRVIKKAGFNICEYGLANQETLLKYEKDNFSKWFRLYNPVLCILNTSIVPPISKKVLERYSKKITLSYKLKKEIELYRNKRS
ncbi:hypothetical protein ACFLY7_00970 [Patescibacteria group bacterium]